MTRAVLAAGLALLLTLPAAACPFCPTQGQTLTGEVNLADFIVLGSLKNAKRDPDDPTRGSTELHIDTVVKPHPYLADKKMLVLPRYVPANGNANAKFLIFCSVYPGSKETVSSAVVSTAVFGNYAGYTLDAYRGEPINAGSKLPEYLKGSQEVRDKDAVTKLRFFFDHLDSPELIISGDAFMEFGNADYADVRKLAEKLPADKLVKWLLDPNTPASRHGLYGMLLGHCGKPADAEALLKMLADPAKQFSSGLDGMLAGGVLLAPKPAWETLVGMAKAEGNEFQVRYAVLRTLRFLWEYRSDATKKDDIVAVMKTLADQADMADMPIEDLRKWEQWQLTGFVVGLAKKPAHAEIGIVRRSILRFALSASEAGNADAKAYVDEMRKADPDRVKLVEDLLKDEKKVTGKQ